MLEIITIPVTLFMQNARILIDTKQKKAVMVDPGGDNLMVIEKLPKDVVVDAIWITHSHIDHVAGLVDLVDQLSKNQDVPKIFAHPDDVHNQSSLAFQSQMMNFPYSGDFKATSFVNEGDIVNVGSYEFKVLNTPGHAVGHVAYFMESDDNQYRVPVVIAGDTLFKGSIGRTDLPGGNYQQLIDSITEKLFTLPENTVVCNGHGPSTTITDEKQHNPFFMFLR